MANPAAAHPAPRAFILALLLLWLGGCRGSGEAGNQANQQLYDYRDTRNVVALLQQAGTRLAAEGDAAFSRFRHEPREWTYRDAYLYAYDLEGRCLFHGGMPELEGQNLLEVEDAEGHKSLQLALAAARDPDNPHGWVHYWWNIPNRLYPVWKSSCHTLVSLPDGRTILLGIGLANLPREREFVKIIVDGAARRLAGAGLAALPELRDPLSKYNLPGASLFVVAADGDTLIAPAFRFGGARNILDYQDDAGHTPLREAILRLQGESDSTWVVILARDPQSMSPAKKGLYVRRVALPGQSLYVGATADLPKPSWMK